MMGQHGMRRVAESADEKARDRGEVVSRLVRYLRPYWAAVLAAFFLVLVNAGTQAAGPFLIGRSIDLYISNGEETGLMNNMLMLIAVYTVGMLSMRFQIYYISWAGQHVLADMRAQIFNKVQSFSLQYLEESEAGDMMSRLVNDIDAISSFFSQGLAQSIGAAFSVDVYYDGAICPHGPPCFPQNQGNYWRCFC